MRPESSLRLRLTRDAQGWRVDAERCDPQRWRTLRSADSARSVYLFRPHDRRLEALADAELEQQIRAILSRRAWPDLCTLLEIDFALVVLDCRASGVLLARGGVGRERLFHRTGAGTFEVESDLLHHVDPHSVDREAFSAYLASAAGPVSGDLTFTARTVASAAGWMRCARAAVTEIDLDGGTSSTHRYTLRPDAQLRQLSDSDLAQAMREAVGSHLARRMPDDVCAVELSGGIDSSVIAANVAQLDPSRCHVGVGVVYPYHEFRHETRYMEDMARKANVRRIELDGRHHLLFDETPTVGPATSEPSLVLMGRAYKALVIEAARGASARVLFNGHGGDQLFAMSPYVQESLVRPLDFRLLDGALRSEVQDQLAQYRSDLEQRDEFGQRHYFAGLLLYDGWMEDFARGTGLRCEPGLLSLRTLQLSWEMFRRPHWVDTGILRKRFARWAFSAGLPESIMQRRWKVGYDGLYRRGLFRNAPRLTGLLQGQSEHLRSMGIRVERCLAMLERAREMRFDDVELLYPILCYALWRASLAPCAAAVK